MATIEISTDYYNDTNYKNYLLRDNRYIAPSGTAILGGSSGWPNLCIMKGTVPTDFSGLSNVGGNYYSLSRQSDILIQWTASQASIYSPPADFSVNVTSNPQVASGNYVAAIASGTATWFWGMGWAPYYYTRLWQQFFGTVGLPGSGADLELVSTNIVSGTQYNLKSMKIQIPLSWSY